MQTGYRNSYQQEDRLALGTAALDVKTRKKYENSIIFHLTFMRTSDRL